MFNDQNEYGETISNGRLAILVLIGILLVTVWLCAASACVNDNPMDGSQAGGHAVTEEQFMAQQGEES